MVSGFVVFLKSPAESEKLNRGPEGLVGKNGRAGSSSRTIPLSILMLRWALVDGSAAFPRQFIAAAPNDEARMRPKRKHPQTADLFQFPHE